jgi:hypothetical protein
LVEGTAIGLEAKPKRSFSELLEAFSENTACVRTRKWDVFGLNIIKPS